MENILGKETRKVWMGFAILWIYIFHLLYFYPSQNYYYYFTWIDKIFAYIYKGWLGVDIFLFLSAYGLCHSYEKNSLEIYYLNRFKRIVPIYIFFFLIVACFLKTIGVKQMY